MDFITCNAFVVFSTENGYTLSLSPINIRKDKILYVDLASVISEFGEFNKLRKAKSREPAKFHILSGEIQGEFTKLTFDEEYFKLICKNVPNPLTSDVFSFFEDNQDTCSIVVDISFTDFLEKYSEQFEGCW
ncbi:hypothetical protein KZ399_06385 [Glaesserella parasuis]|nr:hypothetical protein [Glaesserella parasuis]